MALLALLVGILSALPFASCRDLSAAAPKTSSQDAAVVRPSRDASPIDWRRQSVLSALAGVERHLSIKRAVAALDASVVEVGQGWWKAALKSGNTVVLAAGAEDRDVDEIDIYFQATEGVRLRELVPILGAYKKVFESKTAGVRFDDAPAHGVVVFADLFSSKVLPDSEVVKVTIRRSSVDPDQGTEKSRTRAR